MPNTMRNGRYGTTNSAPRQARRLRLRGVRRPRVSVACARTTLLVGAVIRSLPNDRVSGGLCRLGQAVSQWLQQGGQGLAGDQLGDHRVGPDGLVRVCDQVPADQIWVA